MSTNLNNFAMCTGRLVRNPRFFENKDGSKKVLITVACKRNYVSKSTGRVESDFIELQGFIPAKAQNLGVYAYMSKRDQVSFGYTVETGNYVNQDGNRVYTDTRRIQDVVLRDTKEVAAKHRAMAAQELQQSQQPGVAVAQPEPEQPVIVGQTQLPIVEATPVEYAEEDLDIL